MTTTEYLNYAAGGALKDEWVIPNACGCFDIEIYSGYGYRVFKALLPTMDILKQFRSILPPGDYFLNISKSGVQVQRHLYIP